jgi:hypothetical protein
MSQKDGENVVRIRELGRNGKDSELQVTVRQEPCRQESREKENKDISQDTKGRSL